MKVVKLKEIFKLENLKNEIVEGIKNGKIFIYPTDTIYGLGCNVARIESVKKIYLAKGREIDKPFSVIVPSKEWVFEHTIISKANKEFINKLLPGPYTVILKIKNSSIPNIIISKNKTIGIRIPKNEFTDLIRATGVLFITTSVNLTEAEPVKSIEEIPEQIKNIADYTIDSGILDNKSSRVFDLTTDEIKIVRY